MNTVIEGLLLSIGILLSVLVTVLINLMNGIRKDVQEALKEQKLETSERLKEQKIETNARLLLSDRVLKLETEHNAANPCRFGAV